MTQGMAGTLPLKEACIVDPLSEELTGDRLWTGGKSRGLKKTHQLRRVAVQSCYCLTRRQKDDEKQTPFSNDNECIQQYS